jgi:arylsulfatase A-like enzyme
MTADFDMLPTLVELAELEMPNEIFDLDGLSICQLLEDNDSKWPDRKICSYWRDSKNASIRTEKYTLILELEKFDYCDYETRKYKKLRMPDKNGAFELYDMDNDPEQRNDISAQKPEIVKDLKTAFFDWFNEVK